MPFTADAKVVGASGHCFSSGDGIHRFITELFKESSSIDWWSQDRPGESHMLGIGWVVTGSRSSARIPSFAAP